MSIPVPGQAPTRRWPRPVAAGAAVLLLAGVVALALGLRAARPPAAGAQTTAKPNIVVLLTDDQETRSMRVMKIAAKELKRKGVTMKRYYDNFPLCCPARTTIFTGQYAHNHHVLSNVAPDGGYGVFNELHGDNYLPLWLQAAGYQTSYIGKFENGYAEPDQYGTVPTDVPRGWNDWHVLAPSRAQYFNYTLNQNGTLRKYTEAEDDYSTDVFTNKARRFIRTNARAASPFYLELGYAAPHGGGGGDPGRSCNRAAVPAPRDLGTLKGKFRNILPPSFNEADVSDKPAEVAQKEPLTPGQIRDTLRKRRCAWESLLAVDDSVGALVDEIQRDGIKGNTYIFFLSDNGFLRGEHRIRDNKRFLYEESARVPLIVRGPGIPHNKSSEDVVVNADITSTVLQLSGASPGLVQDGQSLMPRLLDPEGESGRAILLEAYAGDQILGVRTSRYLYTEWNGDKNPLLPEKELYDTYADPYELNNLAGDPAYLPVVLELGQELDDMIDCAGDDCRTAPTGTLSFTNGGVGKNGCVLPPVTAHFTSPDDNRIVGVSFRAGKVAVGDDTAAPFEAAIPQEALSAELPGPATVVAKALYDDGRRLGLTSELTACK
ncbi:MAG: N-acetylglucosamine-6-sulfatase [Solirubrobacterales bacterium]|jgi:arylsulfatase A-like enzyme|nr:N-acetylglucosamine-6-sulfatase [Solirubrobacterales bacterium]